MWIWQDIIIYESALWIRTSLDYLTTTGCYGDTFMQGGSMQRTIFLLDVALYDSFYLKIVCLFINVKFHMFCETCHFSFIRAKYIIRNWQRLKNYLVFCIYHKQLKHFVSSRFLMSKDSSSCTRYFSGKCCRPKLYNNTQNFAR